MTSITTSSVRDDSPTPESKDYAAVKASIIAEFPPRRSQESIMREVVTLKYAGGDVDVFVHKAEKLYREAKFNESAMRGLLRDAISNCPSLFQFVLPATILTGRSDPATNEPGRSKAETPTPFAIDPFGST